MAQINGYKEELQDELKKTDSDSHASRLLTQEIERLEKGDDGKDDRSVAFIDVHPMQPQTVGLKVRIPIREFPRFNFVGKLLGPGGNTLKRLQEETGCKMAIMGKGSMRDKAKEEELRKQGGKKYAHLSDDLHVYVEAFAEVTDGYNRLAHAVSELKRFLIPEMNDDIRQQQMQEMMYMSSDGSTRGRGGFRGGRGGPSPRGGPILGRGARGGAPARGAPRGAPSRGSAARGAPSRGAPSRGAPSRGAGSRGRGGAAAVQSSYDDYGNSNAGYGDSGYGDSGYGDSGYGSSSRGGGGGYDEGYDSRGYGDSSYGSGQADDQYYGSSYGSAAQSSASYDDYSSYDYDDGWGTSGAGGPVKSSGRGGAKPRSHPYSGGRSAY